ncbi:MAG TPA: hypothetical protein VJ063_04100 [Verrucomicrobiae bacterium]|nr:hypothetical protein [Verrucomicrobiae bacterium]
MIRCVCFALLLCTARAFPWGPHAEITQAALDALGTNDLLIRHLGAQAQRLTNYAWMGDYRRLPFEEPDELFYADDYLLFPDATTHWDHICPEVRKTYRPYFRRALQALRTETPRNGARWIGSLLHFVEDTGSPPHAAEIRGALHTRMETWVDAKQIHIRGYQPRLMGTNDEQALDGFVKRMDEIIEYSKERAKRMRLNAEISNRKAVEPVVLESAQETSRLTADLLHTLGVIAAENPKAGGTLRGTVQSHEPVGLERFPAKVAIAGTSYSTLADLRGNFEFRNLPAGDYEIIALRAGNSVTNTAVHVQHGQTNGCRLVLQESSGNLIRNGDFAMHWKDRSAPDCWDFWQGTWNGEIIPLQVNQKYRLAAKFKPDMDAEVLLRWTRHLPHALPRMATAPMFQTRKLTEEESAHEFTASESFGLLQVSIKSSGKRPQDVLESIQLVPVRGN